MRETEREKESRFCGGMRIERERETERERFCIVIEKVLGARGSQKVKIKLCEKQNQSRWHQCKRFCFPYFYVVVNFIKQRIFP